jgi:hypothetical protein
MIPDASLARTTIFGCFVLHSALVLLIRGFGTALLLMTNPAYVLWYSLADHSLYTAQKLLRGDYTHWMPLPPNSLASVVNSIVNRFIGKVIADFVAPIQARGSGEMGGLYFTFNTLLSPVMSVISVSVYYHRFPSEEDQALPPSTAWALVASLTLAWACVFAAMLLIMDKRYLRTFYSIETGNEWTMKIFTRSGAPDAARADIHTYNHTKYVPRRSRARGRARSRTRSVAHALGRARLHAPPLTLPSSLLLASLAGGFRSGPR